MNFSNLFTILFAVGITFDFLLNQGLEFLDYSHRKRHGTEIPHQLLNYREMIDSEKLQKTVEYENEKYFLWIPSNVLHFALNLALVFGGFYVWLFDSIWSRFPNVYAAVLIFAFVESIPSSILGIPFSLYREFKLEKKYGFSNMTFKMYVLDFFKSLVLSVLLAAPLLLAVSSIIIHFNSIWWLLFGLVYLGIALGISYVYPIWIAPLFNKFTPLEDGELKDRIETLFDKTGFKTSGIFKMDASRRSNHSNAYFTGLGKNKRIVLYDTLISQLDAEEIEAVLAHELGHCKHHHVTKRLFAVVPIVFVSLFVLSVLARMTSLFEAFRIDVSGGILPVHQLLGLFLCSIVFSGYGNFAGLISNLFSRRDEFQADAYAKKMCGSGKPLVTALIKLNKENLSEMVPPKIYSLFNSNHPELCERMDKLE